MKQYITPPLIIAMLLSLSGCDLIDKAKNEYKRIKHDYEEYVGADDRGPRPFKPIFQSDESVSFSLVTPECTNNQSPTYIFFETPEEAQNHIYSAIRNLYSYPSQGIRKPFWDVRYTNPISTYINGDDALDFPNHSKNTGIDTRQGVQNITTGSELSQSDDLGTVVQSKCVNDILTLGTTLNLYDAPEQELIYAGISSTFLYQFHTNNHTKPWHTEDNGNLVLQAHFNTPIYHNFESNIGGSVVFNVFLYNPKIKKHLNYVIGLYAFGEAWQREKAGIRFDPTTSVIHVATVAKDTSWWCTPSQKSEQIKEIYNTPNKTTKDDNKWNNFYRVNISYSNLLAVLNELKLNPPQEVSDEDFGLNPQDWEVDLIAIQYELEEQGGAASISGSFSNFGAYISQLPL